LRLTTPQKKQKNKTERKLNHEQSQHVVSLWIGANRCNTGRIARIGEGWTNPRRVSRPSPFWRLGDLEEEDRQENARSLEHGFRLLSAYKTVAGEKLWVITEADRSVTTLLLPSEY
jgi:hypothetical protein